MRNGAFIVNGVNSEDFDTLIQDRPIIEAPPRKVDWKSAYGVDGEIPFDEGAYGNTDLELILVVDSEDLIEGRQEVVRNFENNGSYVDLIPYFDPGKIYRVQVKDKIQFENKRHYGQAQAASVKLTVKPYKYLVDNAPSTFNSKSFSIVNPTNYHSQPRMRIEGTGDVVVSINGNEFKINDLDGHIIIDSERYIAFREGATGPIASENDKIMTREYPILKPVSNSIDISGDVSKVILDPRWRSLV